MASAAYSSPINLQLPRDPPDNFKQEETKAVYDILQQSSQNLIEGMMRYTGAVQQDSSLWSTVTPQETLLTQNHNRLYVKASEALSLGHIVSLHNNAGTINARKANATLADKQADGWCSTTGGIAAGSFGEVILSTGLCLYISGLTVGTRYYLSTTGGLVTSVAPAVSGNIVQYIGVALSATLLYITISPYFTIVP